MVALSVRVPHLLAVFTPLQSRAIFAVPSPLEYFSWVFCFTSFFAGPAFELREYQNSVNRSSAEVAKLPSRVGTVLGRFLFGVRLL